MHDKPLPPATSPDSENQEIWEEGMNLEPSIQRLC